VLTFLVNICSDVVSIFIISNYICWLADSSIVISLPISMVVKLQMPIKQKSGVATMFALGFFVVIASIIRGYYSKPNETMLTCMVSIVETAVVIIATSLPGRPSVLHSIPI
jgi:uncharacterized membrane protein YoaK (UPF0700 family)